MAKRQREEEQDKIYQERYGDSPEKCPDTSNRERKPISLAQILTTFKSVDMAAFRVAFSLYIWRQHCIQIIWTDPKSYLFGWGSNMSIMECKDDIDIQPLSFDAILADMKRASPDCKCFLAHIRASTPQPSHNFMLYFNAVDDLGFKEDLRANVAQLNDVVERINQALTTERPFRFPIDYQYFQERVTLAAANSNCVVTWDLESFSRKTQVMTPAIAAWKRRGNMTIDPITGKINMTDVDTASAANACKPIDSVDAMVDNFVRYICPENYDTSDDKPAPSTVRCSLATANVYDGEEYMIVYFETL